MEHMERSARSSCVEIKNFPVKKPERKLDLLDAVSRISSTLYIAIQPHDIKDIYRVGSKDSESKTLIVDFTSNLTKEKFMRRIKSTTMKTVN